MRTIIAGSRTINDYSIIEEAVEESEFDISFIISGGCKGVDSLAESYAKQNKIPLIIYKPEWAKFGKAAGPIRNKTMAQNADALIAVWDGESRGTFNMIKLAEKYNLEVFVKMV